MKWIFYSCFLFLSSIVCAQSTLIPIGSDQEYYIDRLCIQYGTPAFFHRNVKPYYRKDIIDLLSYWQQEGKLQPRDHSFIRYITNENNEWTWAKGPLGLDEAQLHAIDSSNIFYGYESDKVDSSADLIRYINSKKAFLKYFYRSPSQAVEINQKDFYLRANPVIHVHAGRELSNNENIITNQRGLELRMGLDDKVYAQTTIIENQFSFPLFFRDKIERHKSLPGAGLYKYLTTSSIYKPTGYDFFISNAQFGIKVSKHFHVQLGHGSNFIGDGIRSLFLSDYAQEYFFLKLNTRIWRLQYQNIFAELSASTPTASTIGNVLLPKKYMASHTLQVQVLPRWTVGVFETVLFHRKDHFEFQYLNPVIIYRSVEGSIGSPDNVMLGINSRLDLGRQVSIYGQLLVDEFVQKEVFNSQKGWWGNKFGSQLGIKYINALGVHRLDLQAEYNVVRPYTYSHFDSTANYTHQLTPLAHPLGANFKEYLFRVKYQPTLKWVASGSILAYRLGDDPDRLSNYGSDLTKSYLTRIGDYNNTTTQGDLKNILHLSLQISYQVFHNYYLDFNTYYRKDVNSPNDVTKYLGGGLRVNLWKRDRLE